jgi:hypothetical protein
MHLQVYLLIPLIITSTSSLRRSNEYEDICGWGWQDEYIKLHRGILSGEVPPKYVLAIPVKTGLADNMHGYITAFLWALLSNRAFLIERVDRLNGESQRTVDFAYHSPYINWTSPGLARRDYECLLPPYTGQNHVPCRDDSKFVVFGGRPSLRLKYLNGNNMLFSSSFGQWNFTEQFLDDDILLTCSNRGTTQLMIKNPNHKAELFTRFNFTRQTIFPCLFHFLFHLNRDVCVEGCLSVAETLRHAGRDSHTIRIAMHVRNPGGIISC